MKFPYQWEQTQFAELQRLFQIQLKDWYTLRAKGVRWYFWDTLGILFSEVRYRGRYRWDYPKVNLETCLQYAQPYTALHLDLGCGDGTWLIKKALQHPHIHYIGIDRDPRQIFNCIYKAARAFSIDYNHLKRFPNITFLFTNMLFLPRLFSENTFHSISCNYPVPYRDTFINKLNSTHMLGTHSVITPYLIQAMHSVLINHKKNENYGTIIICTNHLDQALQIIATFAHKTCRKLFVSGYPPPYFSLNCPKYYGLKSFTSETSLDGTQLPHIPPTVKIFLNMDDEERNKIACESIDGSKTVTYLERIKELKSSIKFGTPSDWNIIPQGIIPPEPIIPTFSLKKQHTQVNDPLLTTIGQKKIFWNMLSKYFKKYETSAINSIVDMTQATLNNEYYEVCMTPTIDTFNNDVSKSYIQFKKKNVLLIKNNKDHLNINSSFLTQKQIDKEAMSIVWSYPETNHSTHLSHIDTIKESNHRGYILGHGSVSSLNDVKINYACIPPSTLISSSIKPYVKTEQPYVTDSSQQHYMIFYKLNNEEINIPQAGQIRPSYVPSRLREQSKFRKFQQKPMYLKIPFSRFKLLTKKGRRQYYALVQAQQQQNLKKEWMLQKKQLLKGCSEMAQND